MSKKFFAEFKCSQGGIAKYQIDSSSTRYESVTITVSGEHMPAGILARRIAGMLNARKPKRNNLPSIGQWKRAQSFIKKAKKALAEGDWA